MSLYIGNLSSGIRGDELERVFQKFGRCSLRLKDGYGFVVYEFPPNAEKALRALRNKYICGELLTLTWSNRQPGAFRGVGRGGISYEMPRGRDGAREGDWRGRIAERDRERRSGSYDELTDEEAAHDRDGMRDYVDEDGEQRRITDDDRWGAQFEGALNGNGPDNGEDFGRYEPFRDYGRNDDADENPVLPISRGDAGRDHGREYAMYRSNRANAKQGCYQCGALGHKMRDCPGGNVSRRKWYRFDRRHDGDNKRKDMGREEIERLNSRPKKKVRGSQDSGPVSRETSGVKSPHSVEHRRSTRVGSSPIRTEAYNSQKNDYEGKRQSRKETESVKDYSRKKGKSSVSSHLHSDDNESRSHSKSHSSNHIHGYHSRSRSRSVSSRTHSASSSSRSSTTTRNCGPGGLTSRSRSGSPTSLSPSVPTDQPLTAEIYSNNVVDPEMKEVITEQEQMVEVGSFLKDAKPESLSAATNDKIATSPSELGKMERDGPPEENTENYEIVSGLADDLAKGSKDPVDETFIAAGNCLDQRLIGTKDFQNCDGIMTEHSTNSLINSKDHGTSYTSSSTKISSEELSMVLKHYGLSLFNESSISLPPEEYFGSARLWPWEVIYYRRLKKGPISLKNYARRIEQNREFGIVDKYIRSSSGWGELGQGNF